MSDLEKLLPAPVANPNLNQEVVNSLREASEAMASDRDVSRLHADAADQIVRSARLEGQARAYREAKNYKVPWSVLAVSGVAGLMVAHYGLPGRVIGKVADKGADRLAGKIVGKD